MLATILGETLSVPLSPTFLQHASCPLCLRWSYVDKSVPRLPRLSTLRGAVAHLAIALLSEHCMKADTPPSQLTDTHLRNAIVVSAPHEVYSELGTIFEWLSLWRERFALRPKHLVGYEERMAIDETFREVVWSQAAYRGIVDVIHLVGRTAIVTDYKGKPNVLSQAALAEHEQGWFYCWLVSKFYPQAEEFVFRIWYLRYGFYAETRRTRRQLDAFEQVLFMKRDKIAAIERWEPIAGQHCAVCDFVPICPLATGASELPVQIRTKDEAVRVASELRVKEQWVKEARAQLKTYVEHNDDVELSGYAYGFRGPTAHAKTPFRGYNLVSDDRAAGDEGDTA